MSPDPAAGDLDRLRFLLAVIRRDLAGAGFFLAGFSKDRRPLDRLTTAWGELNEEAPMVAANLHRSIRKLERGLPSDPDRALEEYRAEILARAEFVPPSTLLPDIYEVSEKEIAKRAQELRPEDFTD